ncbi:hypothetical protein AAVH_13881 [Aphelenchoides avenae]|nr:hypothetical protein AAVH_13881 [Aphelenchus avenae]
MTLSEVPMWAQFLVKKCPGTEERTVHKIEGSTVTGIDFSADAIKGRVIVAIAGSKRTVKEGMKEIIRRIEGHAQYKAEDICLRRIKGQSVDTDGFKKMADAKPLDLSSCKEPFDWDRLTRERWCYIGAPHGGRPPKRPRQPSV